MWRASVLTIFPEMFPGPLGISLAGKALAAGLWSLDTIDIRDHATDKHRSVDDTPAGGGPGMVMKADVLARALDAATAGEPRPRLLMSPRGAPLTQARVEALAAGAGALLVCGRFEGIDQRLIEARGLEEVSMGDYVLSGGEIAAMALIDACVRLLPGVIGKEASVAEESFAEGLLEYPHYTRPSVWEGRAIPEVLLSGDHARIAAWRRAEAEKVTRERRPDLWAAYVTKLSSAPSKAPKRSIGPHEERELELMKSGAKPLSMFVAPTTEEFELFSEEQFDRLVNQGKLVKKVAVEDAVAPNGSPIQLRRVLYALPGEEWRIEAMLLVLNAYASFGPGRSRDLERMAGLLLGYDQRDIENFINSVTFPSDGGHGRG
jgi:tRNA (guanine37-N1)-methyltransferase